jgi:hypothetical protein
MEMDERYVWMDDGHVARRLGPPRWGFWPIGGATGPRVALRSTLG